jgi:putative methionine-R-sulfoxide reductase with GAF domain
MISRLQGLVNPASHIDGADAVGNANLVKLGLLATLAAGILIPLTVPPPAAISRSAYAAFAVVDVAALGLLLLAQSGHLQAAARLFPLLLWGMFSVWIYLSEGLQDAAVGGYFFVLILTTVLSTARVTLGYAFLSILSLTGVYLGTTRDALAVAGHVPTGLPSLIGLGVLLVGSAYLLSVAVPRIRAAFEQARQNQRALMKANRSLRARETMMAVRAQELDATAAELAASRAQLEEADRRLQEALDREQRRADLLQTSAQVSRAIARVRDVDRLLSQLTGLISQHLGFYHVGIFLLDDTGRYAFLRAANSEGGQRMLARAHKLSVGSQGIVGYVTSTGQARIADDVGVDATYFDNPELSQTRSEMAIPLRIENDIIGALDVQSSEPAAFSQDDVNLTTVLADQIAVAIENARLFQRTQAALAEAQQSYRRYLKQEWDSFFRRATVDGDDAQSQRG